MIFSVMYTFAKGLNEMPRGLTVSSMLIADMNPFVKEVTSSSEKISLL